MFYSKSKVILDFFLPRFCVSCRKKLIINEEIICAQCFSHFEVADFERIENEYIKKFSEDNYLSDFSSAFIFQEGFELQKLIHSLKYDKNYHVGKFLGKITAELLSEKILLWKSNLIIPIPLHILRKADRGFNQANEIANGISKSLKIPIKSNILKRKIYTVTQTKLNLKERKKNIEGAFRLNKSAEIIGKNILLVDDVITTGATINECAKVLKQNGANKICAISAAIAD